MAEVNGFGYCLAFKMQVSKKRELVSADYRLLALVVPLHYPYLSNSRKSRFLVIQYNC